VPPLTLRHYLRERRPFNAYVKQIEDARERLFRLFPVAVPVAGDTVVFVVNSCVGLQMHPATNALGHVGRAQYQRLERLAAASSTLGDELARDPRPQLERYDFADAAEGATVGIFRRVVRPQPAVLAAKAIPL